MTLNHAEEREQIIFKQSYNPDYYRKGGLRRFEGLSIEQIEALVKNGFLDPKECGGDSPPVDELLRFAIENCHSNLNFTFRGYAVSPKRDDCRVTINGITAHGDITQEFLFRWIPLIKYAETDTNATRAIANWDY